ncbi:uncharacterized protein LOC124688695 [Lolium rigidum]|uniref:uncharacterized protein LOC124688695 n=1 Tax=Lolium rigidum TaxID=89674 RepID=UPI001F5D6EFD|nr:uncharacterized protein LOC124688695 [Lolium rigidum]
MPRASGSAARPPAAAKNVSSNAGHSEPSCSTPAYQKVYRPVTRSMTRLPPAVAATPGEKERVDSTSSRKSTPDACFSIQLAASRPTVTRARTPHGVTKSAWKPLTQPAVLSEELKRASPPATNPTAKRSRVTSSQAAKDSASKSNRNVRSGKNNRNEECASQGDQLDGPVIPSLPKKLQSGKSSSDVVSKRNPTIRSQGAKLAAPVLMKESETETGKDSASVVPLLARQLHFETPKTSEVNQSVAPAIAEATSSGTTQVNQSVAPATTDAIVRERRQVNQSVTPVFPEAGGNRTRQINHSFAPVLPEAVGSTRQINHSFAPVFPEANSNRTQQINRPFAPAFPDHSFAPVFPGHSFVPVIGEAIGHRTRQINQFVAPVSTEAIDNRTRPVNQLRAPIVTLPRQQLQTNNQQRFTRMPLPTSQASLPAGATGPVVVPKLEIGNVNDPPKVPPHPAYRRALLIRQQEQLLEQFKLANSQSELHIKGPALFEDDDVPEPEPLGTRCALCKIDLAFRTQGAAAHDPLAPPVVAVLACHHTFHSSCIEDVYGVAEPSECIACLDSETAH